MLQIIFVELEMKEDTSLKHLMNLQMKLEKALIPTHSMDGLVLLLF